MVPCGEAGNATCAGDKLKQLQGERERVEEEEEEEEKEEEGDDRGPYLSHSQQGSC